MIRVHFLGTGDAFGSGGRYHTCFIVDTGSFRFLPRDGRPMRSLFGLVFSLADTARKVRRLHPEESLCNRRRLLW